MTSLPKIVTLNVGGEIVTTSLRTLLRYPESMLGRMFSGDYTLSCDSEGRYFIDANGKMFYHILDFLRRNKLVLPHGFKEHDLLLAEAEYLQILPIIKELRKVSESDIITINVGGTIYAVNRETIMKFPDSYLALLINGDIGGNYDGAGRYFVNTDGQIFRHILNYMRHDELYLKNDFEEYDLLLLETERHNIKPLMKIIRNLNYRIDLVSLDVGGTLYHTSYKTIQKHPHSNLRSLLTNMDENGRYILKEANIDLFPYVLDYLRKDRLTLPADFKDHDKLLAEARFFDIDPMICDLRKTIEGSKEHIQQDDESNS